LFTGAGRFVMKNRVLFISPERGDAGALSRILDATPLDVSHARGLEEAAAQLRRTRFSAILTESRLPDGCWKDVLALASKTPEPCAVIVTDRLADDLLWAEVLNLGAYDVLAQPFDSGEVVRILQNACQQGRVGPPAAVEQPARGYRSAY
jgi:two-component system response regulator PilR (NtrC family)